MEIKTPLTSILGNVQLAMRHLSRLSPTDKEATQEQQQKRVWERFYRVPGIQVQNGSGIGLGLGLAICRFIIEQHDGQVGVESMPGQGAIFWFTLPITAQQAVD